jgi:hypothetical protein
MCPAPRLTFTCEASEGTFNLHFAASEGTYSAWWSRMDVVIYGWPSAKTTVTLDEKTIANPQYDPANGTLKVQIPIRHKAAIFE